MFTGIIEAIGHIVNRQPKGGDCRLQIQSAGLDMSDVKLGDSIATNGVCLTVTELMADGFWADVSNETLNHSSLANLPVGAKVNLEKAMLATSRFGGHIVSGHVDGIAKIASLKNDGRSVVVEVIPPAMLNKYIAHKGSITIDGVSLTANALTAEGFLLNIVPHTAAETIINDYRVGTEVNIEVDVIARYLERLMQADGHTGDGENSPSSAIDKNFLAKHGFYR